MNSAREAGVACPSRVPAGFVHSCPHIIKVLHLLPPSPALAASSEVPALCQRRCFLYIMGLFSVCPSDPVFCSSSLALSCPSPLPMPMFFSILKCICSSPWFYSSSVLLAIFHGASCVISPYDFAVLFYEENDCLSLFFLL